MNFRQEWPLTERDSVIQVRGLYRVVLPDDKHPQAVLEELDGQMVWLHFEKFTMLKNVEREVRKLNEWKRLRGGRRKKEEED